MIANYSLLDAQGACCDKLDGDFDTAPSKVYLSARCRLGRCTEKTYHVKCHVNWCPLDTYQPPETGSTMWVFPHSATYTDS